MSFAPPNNAPSVMPTKIGVGRHGQTVILTIGNGQVMLDRNLAINLAAAILKNADMDINAMRVEVQTIARLLDPETVSLAIWGAVKAEADALGSQDISGLNYDDVTKNFIALITTGRKA